MRKCIIEYEEIYVKSVRNASAKKNKLTYSSITIKIFVRKTEKTRREVSHVRYEGIFGGKQSVLSD